MMAISLRPRPHAFRKDVYLLVSTLLLAVLPLLAQEYEHREIKIDVKDQFGRELVVGEKGASLGLRLAPGDQQNPPLSTGKQIGDAELAYTSGEQGWQRFVINEGTARAKFLVPKDDRLSLKYELVALVKDPGDNRERQVKLLPSTVDVSKGGKSSVSASTPSYKAPLQGWEWLLFIGFGLLSLLLIYFLFFREFFRRLLFNRRWRVGEAESWSNGLSIFMVLLLVPAMLVLFLSPDWIKGMYLASCLVAMGSYLLLVLTSFTIAIVATGRK